MGNTSINGSVEFPIHDDANRQAFGSVVLENDSWVTPRSAFGATVTVSELLTHRAAIKKGGVLTWQWFESEAEAEGWCKTMREQHTEISDRVVQLEEELDDIRDEVADLKKMLSDLGNPGSDLERAMEAHEREHH